VIPQGGDLKPGEPYRGFIFLGRVSTRGLQNGSRDLAVFIEVAAKSADFESADGLLVVPPRGRYSMTRTRLAALVLGAALLCGCTGVNEGDISEGFSACSSKVTKNVYDGPNYWGTIAIQNSGSVEWSGYSVGFDVQSGAHCTNDAVPSGAKLSPLSGSGSSAHTTSNHCVFTWAGSTLGAGASKTFNYSTDSTGFSAAQNVVASAASCGGSGGGGGGGAGGGGGGGAGGGGGGGGGGHSSDLIYSEMLRRVREEQEQLGQLINHPF
jgi:hypothetical protein